MMKTLKGWPSLFVGLVLILSICGLQGRAVFATANEIEYVFDTPYQHDDIHLQFVLTAMPGDGTCEMDVHAYDVDRHPDPSSGFQPEQDDVILNGANLGYLLGENNEWHTTKFEFSCSLLLEGVNDLDILVDVLDHVWATSIEWIKLRGEGMEGYFPPDDMPPLIQVPGSRVIDVGGVIAAAQEVNGQMRIYSVEPGTTFTVGWKDNLCQNSTNNVETTEIMGNVGVIFDWNPSASVSLELAGWVGEGHTKTTIPVGLTADDFRRDAVYDPERDAWYLVLEPNQVWADYCLFDPSSPCIFVTRQ